MRRAARRRSSNIRWLIAALALLLIAAALAVFLFWPHGGPVTGSEPLPFTTATATVTSVPPTSAPPTTSTTAAPASTTTTEPLPTPPLAFDTDRAMSHIEALATRIGVRKAGGANEDAAVSYAAQYLEGLGYAVAVTEVPLPDGRVSHNVRAAKEGASTSMILLGAHLDSKAPAPGANDNASGVAVVLELARDFREADIPVSLGFVLFGTEEIIDSNKNHHHYGSRQYVQDMTEAERAALVGMISVDMVGYGQELLVRNMGRGPQLLTDMLLASSEKRGLSSRYEQDTGSSGWSDHEAFESAGYPVAWLEWLDDPTYHTAGDTYDHCDPAVVRGTGEMLRDFLLELTEPELEALAGARRSQ